MNGSQCFAVCEWYGVTCDNEKQNILAITMVDAPLDGTTIPTEFNQLTQLKQFIMTNSGLIGTVPRNFLQGNDDSVQESATATGATSASALEVINLSFNRLTGSIPTFPKSSNLKLYHVGHNQLTGSIPNDGIGAASDLITLSAPVRAGTDKK